MRDPIIREVETAKGRRLGFATGIHPLRFRHADTVAIKKSAGIIVRPDGCTDSWPIENLIEIDGEMVAIGPWLSTTAPLENHDINERFLSLLLAAVKTLATLGFPLTGFYQRICRGLDDGGLVVFPPALAAWGREVIPQDTLEDEWEKWNHPDLDGETPGLFHWVSSPGQSSRAAIPSTANAVKTGVNGYAGGYCRHGPWRRLGWKTAPVNSSSPPSPERGTTVPVYPNGRRLSPGGTAKASYAAGNPMFPSVTGNRRTVKHEFWRRN